MVVCCTARFWCYFLYSLYRFQRGVDWCMFFVFCVYLPHRTCHTDLGCPKETNCHLHLRAIMKTTKQRNDYDHFWYLVQLSLVL